MNGLLLALFLTVGSPEPGEQVALAVESVDVEQRVFQEIAEVVETQIRARGFVVRRDGCAGCPIRASLSVIRGVNRLSVGFSFDRSGGEIVVDLNPSEAQRREVAGLVDRLIATKKRTPAVVQQVVEPPPERGESTDRGALPYVLVGVGVTAVIASTIAALLSESARESVLDGPRYGPDYRGDVERTESLRVAAFVGVGIGGGSSLAALALLLAD